MQIQVTSSGDVSGNWTENEIPTGPRFMEGSGSLAWSPEFAEFVVWREQRAQRAKAPDGEAA
jgi:hypothetical protein